MCVYVCVYVYVCVWATCSYVFSGQCQVSSLIILHFIFWNIVSHLEECSPKSHVSVYNSQPITNGKVLEIFRGGAYRSPQLWGKPVEQRRRPQLYSSLFLPPTYEVRRSLSSPQASSRMCHLLHRLIAHELEPPKPRAMMRRSLSVTISGTWYCHGKRIDEACGAAGGVGELECEETSWAPAVETRERR